MDQEEKTLFNCILRFLQDQNERCLCSLMLQYWSYWGGVLLAHCRVNQTINLGRVPRLHPSSSTATCVFVLHATGSCSHTFVSGAKDVRKYKTNTWSEKGSDTVGCHRLDQSSFLTLVVGGKNYLILSQSDTVCTKSLTVSWNVPLSVGRLLVKEMMHLVTDWAPNH